MPTAFSPVRQRKRRRRRRIVCFCLGLIFVLGLTGYVLFSRLTAIQGVLVENLPEQYRDAITRVVSRSLETDYLKIVPGNRAGLFFLSRAKGVSQECLRRFPELAQTRLRYDLLSRLLIVEAKFRVPVALLCEANKNCRLADDQGIMFSNLANDALTLGSPVLIIWELAAELSSQNLVRQSAIGFIKEFSKLSAGLINIRSFVFRENYFQAGTLLVDTDPGWQLLLDEKTRPYVVAQNLRTLFQKELSPTSSRLLYIDARFEDRVYYKLR